MINSFSQEGRYIVARDFLSVKTWDTHMNSQPIKTIPVNTYLRPALAELYEKDCMFDKFRVISSCDGSKYLTGSYR